MSNKQKEEEKKADEAYEKGFNHGVLMTLFCALITAIIIKIFFPLP